MTILEVIQRSSDFLAKKGVESPRLQVELILAHVLQMPRMKLYLSFERVLAEGELKALRSLIQRRGNREPLQYVVGSMNFCGLELTVNPQVLIPRPETELLAEKAWKLSTLNSPSSEALREGGSPSTVLDLCTGSGCLAIAVAVKAPQAQVHATDISAEALGVAEKNAERHNVQIHFHQGDCFGGLPKDLRFDLVISNPPYIPAAELAGLEPEVRDHEPRSALDGGADGLDFYRRIAIEARPFMAPKGMIMLELGDGQAKAAGEIFQQQKWIVETVEADYNQRPRILTARFEA